MENNFQNSPNNQLDLKENKFSNFFKKKNNLIMVIVLLVVLIGIIAGVFYFLVSSGDKEIQKESSALMKCESEFQKAFSVVEFDESLCVQDDLMKGEIEEVQIKKNKTNIVMIFDSSGSMAEIIDGKSKMEIAKIATNKFIENIEDSGSNLGVIVYGHKGSNSPSDKKVSCDGIEEAYWFGKIESNIVKSKFNDLKPVGWTPIAGSLEKAKNILIEKSSKNDNNIILLVSDGEETCDGDPITITKNIKTFGYDIKVNVIGFDVGGATEDQLRKIAEAGDGQYSSVKNEKDFEAIFQKQENMINKMDFAVKSGVEQLYNISSSTLKYNQCLMMLNIEEAAFMLNLEESISSQCRDSAEKKYFERYDEMKNMLDGVFESEKKNFNDIVTVEK